MIALPDGAGSVWDALVGFSTDRRKAVRENPVLRLSDEDGINAVRGILPCCWFDRDRCAEGLKVLRQFRREWDDTRKVFLERYHHDWDSMRQPTRT